MKKLLLSLIAILFAINVYAQPNTITYQGVLTNAGGAVVTETPNITFALFDAETNGNQLWTETHNNVSVTNGLFQVELNSVATNWGTANFTTDMWLQITVGATTLTPRVKFNANGYSFRSALATSSTSATSATTATTTTNIASGAQGSIPYQTAPGTTTMLAKGTAGQVLTMDAGATAPEWVDLTYDLVNPSMQNGDLVFGDEESPIGYSVLNKGSAGQVLTMNAGATYPEWKTPSGGGTLFAQSYNVSTDNSYGDGTYYLTMGGGMFTSEMDSWLIVPKSGSTIKIYAAFSGPTTGSYTLTVRKGTISGNTTSLSSTGLQVVLNSSNQTANASASIPYTIGDVYSVELVGNQAITTNAKSLTVVVIFE